MEPVFIGGADDDLAPFARYRTLRGRAARRSQIAAGRGLPVRGQRFRPGPHGGGFGLPVVVIFGPSDPAIWGPWRTRRRDGDAPPAAPRQCWKRQVLDALARLRVHA